LTKCSYCHKGLNSSNIRVCKRIF